MGATPRFKVTLRDICSEIFHTDHAGKLCQGVPPDRNNSATIAAFGSSWYQWADGVKQPCTGNVAGSQCVADCAANTEGLGFGAECKATANGGQWAAWGTCSGGQRKCVL